jgi:hypothetical protein
VRIIFIKSCISLVVFHCGEVPASIGQCVTEDSERYEG